MARAVYKMDSPFEKAVQEVEALMQKLGLKLIAGRIDVEWTGPNGKQTATIKDTENGEFGTFPRWVESERLVIEED